MADFQQLHTRGLCYQDLNFGSFFVDPIRGGVLICDADNITVEGLLGGVLGTPKFMAPEVVRRETIPSSGTDLYSMAVLFFYALFQWHPLEGKREAAIRERTPETQLQLYGREPLFLFDPSSDANGPVAGTHDWVVARWMRCRPRCASSSCGPSPTGCTAPRRACSTEWRSAMARLRDAVTPCPSCSFEIPMDVAANEVVPACPLCGGHVPRPVRMTLGRYLVAMRPDRQLLAHHVEPAAPRRAVPATRSRPSTGTRPTRRSSACAT